MAAREMIRTSFSLPLELQDKLDKIESEAKQAGIRKPSTSLVLSSLIAMFDAKKHGADFAAECLRQRGKDVRTKEGRKAATSSPGRNQASVTKRKTKKSTKTKRTTSDDLGSFLGR
jgi:hypothetical protein